MAGEAGAPAEAETTEVIRRLSPRSPPAPLMKAETANDLLRCFREENSLFRLLFLCIGSKLD
jgi:hypothetical protein